MWAEGRSVRIGFLENVTQKSLVGLIRFNPDIILGAGTVGPSRLGTHLMELMHDQKPKPPIAKIISSIWANHENILKNKYLMRI